MIEWLMAILLAVSLGLSMNQKSDIDLLKNELSEVQGVKVETRQGLAVIFFQDTMFPSGEHELKGAALTNAALVGEVLSKRLSKRYLYVEGHTDSKGSKEYNLKLSTLRAESVARVIIDNGGSARRVDTIGYGSDHPECENDTSKGRSCNRRVQIVVMHDKLN